MKTTALTIGAVALLSQGRALADGGGGGNSSSTIPPINPPYGAGLYKTEPLTAKPSTTKVVDFGDFTFTTSIVSPCAALVCKVYDDDVKYTCKVVVTHKHDGSETGWDATILRYFIAYQTGTSDNHVIHSWEVKSDHGASIQPAAIVEVYRAGSVPLGETLYNIGIRTTRTAVGENTVAVNACAVLTRVSDGNVTALDSTADRQTVWNICNSDQ
ncbi:MAG: hypothetical protein WCK77_08600 [Verrucomicrobiota bacterium]